MHDQKEEDIHCCFCFSKGRAGLSVQMDKNVYCPGETAQIIGNVDMSKSKADLTKMDVDFIRVISLKADGKFKQLRDTISGKDYLTEGVKPGEKRDSVYMPLPLTGEVFPSTQGQYLKCEYHVDVNCDISWASDVSMHMPITIVPAPPVIWQPPSGVVFETVQQQQT